MFALGTKKRKYLQEPCVGVSFEYIKPFRKQFDFPTAKDGGGRSIYVSECVYGCIHACMCLCVRACL